MSSGPRIGDTPGRCVRLTLLAGAFWTFGCASEPAPKPITGQIFIVTAGRETIKLSLVEVLVFPSRLIEQHVAQRTSAADSIRSSINSQIEQATVNGRVLIERLASERRAEKDIELKYIRGEVSTEAWQASKRPPANTAREAEGVSRHIAELQSARARVDFDVPFYLAGLPTPLTQTKTDADGKFSFSGVARDSLIIVAAADRQVPTTIEHYLWLVRVPSANATNSPLILSNDNLAVLGDRGMMIRGER